jgi:hypothetical protein
VPTFPNYLFFDRVLIFIFINFEKSQLVRSKGDRTMFSLAFAFRRLSSSVVAIKSAMAPPMVAHPAHPKLSRHQCFATTPIHLSSSDHPRGSQNCPCFFCKSTGAKDNDDDRTRAHHVLDDAKERLIFTGIVEHPDGTHIKLDDPSSLDISRDAPGHVMEYWEIALEAASYSNLSGYDQLQEEFNFPPIRTNVKLLNFSNHPAYYENQVINGAFCDVDYDAIYPFPNELEFPYDSPLDPMVPKRIRSGDAVMCVSRSGSNRNNDMAFWATVLSVTSTGIIIAESKAHVPNVRPKPLQENDWLQFLVTNVMGMRKGPNWQRTRQQRPQPRRKDKSNQDSQ